VTTQSETYLSQRPPVTPRKIKAGPPLSWISGSLRLLRENWGVILPAYFLVILAPVLAQVGLFSTISRSGFGTIVLIVAAIILLTLLLNAGLIAMFHSVAEGRPRFSQVFAGFGGHSLLHILLMVVLMAVASLAMAGVGYWVFSVIDISSWMSGMGQYGGYMGPSSGGQSGMVWVVLAVVAGFAALTVFFALFCYAIPLIVVSRQGAMNATVNSFRASFKNLFVLMFFAVNALAFSQLLFAPFILVSASSASAIFITVMAFLVLFVSGAVISGAYYLSFRDILLADPLPADEAEAGDAALA